MGDSGCTVRTIKPGDATNYPQANHTASMHYVGRLEDGTVFDSSRRRGRPFQFKVGVGSVIRAWDETVPQMSVGQIVELTAPAEYAYGANGYPPVIPANATLIFEMELLSFH
ncbi:unnamed protein product [Phaeothamnion confervicola]